MYVLKIPARYTSKQATDEDKEVYEFYQKWIEDLNNGVARPYVLPQAFDPESRQPLFDIINTESL